MIANGWFQRIMNLLNLDFNMCLNINKAIHRKIFGKYIPIKTKEDLTVYKGVNVDWNKKDIYRVYSAVFNFSYLIGDTYFTRLGLDYTNYDIVTSVYEGFHSYMTMSLVRNSRVCEKCNGLARCIIPKGSKIFLSNFGEIVSNKIKIIGVEKL